MRRILSLAAAVAASVLVTGPGQAQELIIDGIYDCARATNGRAYCRQRSTRNYTPVSDEFFQRYQAVRAGSPVGGPSTVVQQNQQINNTLNASLNAQGA